MKKLLLVVVLLAIVGGGGYGVWWYTQSAPDAETDATTEAPPSSPSEPAEATPPPAPAGPLALTAVGCELEAATGWAIDEAAQEVAVVPGGQAVVLRKGAAGAAPFLVIGRVTSDALGARDPARYPNTFVAELRSRFTKLQPAPAITSSGAPKELPALFTAGQELLAEGAFNRLGLPTGSGRFLAGVTADQQVYLVVAFTAAGSPDEAEGDTMIASLKPLPKAEAGATEGLPAEAGGAPAEAETGAAPAEAESGAGAAAPAEPEAAPAAAPATGAAPAGENRDPAPAGAAKPAEKPDPATGAKPAAPAAPKPTDKPAAAAPSHAAPAAGEAKPSEEL